MKKLLTLIVFIIGIVLYSTDVHAEQATPKPVIIDTDFASDCDDILALRLAMIYDTMGYIDIKGIALSTNYSRSPQAVSSLLKIDGFPSVPISMGTDYNYSVQVATKYVDVLCSYGGYSDYIDTVPMYRKILAESTEKVDIITLGFLQNIERLLISGPDQYSTLSGANLVAEKVDKIYIVGGNFNGSPSFNFYWTGDVVKDAAQYVNANCPVPIVYLTSALGGDVWNCSYHQSDWKPSDPVTACLKANGQSTGIIGWDTAAMYGYIHCVIGDNVEEGMMLVPGRMSIWENGSTKWINNDQSKDFVLMKVNPGQYYSDKIDALLYKKHMEVKGR